MKTLVTLIALLAAIPVCATGLESNQPSLRWTMLNVTPNEGQADCNLLEMPDHAMILIDVADGYDAPDVAVRQLHRLGVKHLSLVVISHFHRDHYGRLLDLIRSGVAVDNVVLNLPDRRITLPEMPWGCDWDDVQAMLAELRKRQIPYHIPAAGESLYHYSAGDGTAADIEVLCAYDGMNTPVGETDVNDTSIILRVSFGKTRILFTGDLNWKLGAYLATSDLDLRADLVKAPHHGTDNLAPDAFFDRTQAQAIFVPSPKKLWESARSKRLRNYVIEHKIPVYVSGLNGIVTTTLTGKGYVIETER